MAPRRGDLIHKICGGQFGLWPIELVVHMDILWSIEKYKSQKGITYPNSVMTKSYGLSE